MKLSRARRTRGSRDFAKKSIPEKTWFKDIRKLRAR